MEGERMFVNVDVKVNVSWRKVEGRKWKGRSEMGDGGLIVYVYDYVYETLKR